MDARLSQLLDKQDIQDVVFRYCRGIDRRDFALVRACYHPGALDHHGGFSGDIDAFINWVEPLTARYRFTQHLISNILVDFGEDENLAASESYGVSIHRSSEPKPYLNLATGFRYLDRFERRAGEWKIAERTAIGEWSIQLDSKTWWEIPEEHEAGRRDGGDALYRLLTSIGQPMPMPTPTPTPADENPPT